ncbi:hypothetical protein BACCIP111883_03867 [Sutcliffiella rhizosphaerae]|uniref:Uncharacterized protein n=1 Tax=Sutcliffiella rhizosphaerae TaxID=2880967 RepID=A0ABM8YST6_9BACI|nr:hypothetical protein BACCIP111883_03867 [Sutcliffiella rhizosphaerae]
MERNFKSRLFTGLCKNLTKNVTAKTLREIRVFRKNKIIYITFVLNVHSKCRHMKIIVEGNILTVHISGCYNFKFYLIFFEKYAIVTIV